MAIILYSLLFIMVMPYLAKVPLVYAMNQESHYDNAYPREQQKRLSGFGARTNAAHYNCFEALACFAPSVLAVVATQSVNTVAIVCALTFVIARITYVFCYWINLPTLRSLVWLLAMAANIVLFLQAL